MNTEQLIAEFEAWVATSDRNAWFMPNYSEQHGYIDGITNVAFLSYQVAAKSRDELIGKLVKAIGNAREGFSMIYRAAYHGATEVTELDDLTYCGSKADLYKDLTEQALAEAAAQGYGE